jgi:hypothetical protein
MIYGNKNEILARPGTKINSNWANRENSCLSPVHLKMEEDADPEALWVFEV